jgi:hypothetical protein
MALSCSWSSFDNNVSILLLYRFRKVLIECGVLEPLCSLARSEDVELEIQRYAVLAIASKLLCCCLCFIAL